VDKKEVEKDPNDLIEKWNSKFSEKEANEFDKYKWFSDMKEDGFKLSDIYELIRKK
jgi:hypothetical protein